MIDKQALNQAKGVAYPEFLNTPKLDLDRRAGDRIKVLNHYLYKQNIQTFSSLPYTEFEVYEVTANYYRVAPIQTLITSESRVVANQGTYLINK